jgi:hypothetical protein
MVYLASSGISDLHVESHNEYGWRVDFDFSVPRPFLGDPLYPNPVFPRCGDIGEVCGAGDYTFAAADRGYRDLVYGTYTLTRVGGDAAGRYKLTRVSAIPHLSSLALLRLGSLVALTAIAAAKKSAIEPSDPDGTAMTLPMVAPPTSCSRALPGFPCVIAWDPKTGEFR